MAPAAPQRRVAGGQLLEQRLGRPEIDRQVMSGQEQQATVGAAVADARAQERPARDVERDSGLVAGAPPERLVVQTAHAHDLEVDIDPVVDPLQRGTSVSLVGGAQGRMAIHGVLERAAQRVHIERPVHPRGHGQVEDGRLRIELVDEPQRLLLAAEGEVARMIGRRRGGDRCRARVVSRGQLLERGSVEKSRRADRGAGLFLDRMSQLDGVERAQPQVRESIGLDRSRPRPPRTVGPALRPARRAHRRARPSAPPASLAGPRAKARRERSARNRPTEARRGRRRAGPCHSRS